MSSKFTKKYSFNFLCNSASVYHN